MPVERQSIFLNPEGEGGAQALPFVVELWTEDKAAVETILARVQNVSLAHAVFSASRSEYPSRYITLRRGESVIAETGDGRAAKSS